MNIQSATAFFKWCSIINICMFAFAVLAVLVASDFIYIIHGQWFGITREAYDMLIYGFLGLYKILILVFNLVPYISLRIMG